MQNFKINNKISLNALELDDAETLFALIDANRQYLRQWLPWLDYNQSAEDSRGFIKTITQQEQEGDGFMRGIYFENKLVGTCGYLPIVHMNHSVMIGYWLAEEMQGKGIVTDCCRFLIDYAFEQLDVNKVNIAAAVDNVKSRAICERLGLVLEGIERDGEFLYERYVDIARYSILRREWERV